MRTIVFSKGLKLGGLVLLALALIALSIVDYSDPPNVLLFVGRFHPLVVHLPIGVLLLAFLMEGAALLWAPLKELRQAAFFVLMVGTAGAVLAVVAGLFLSLEGGYGGATLSWHRWLGIGVAAGSLIALALKALGRRRQRPARWLRRSYLGVLTGTVGLLAVAGHLGGNLTHGSGYLTEYMPSSLNRVMAFAGASGAPAGAIANVDSAVVYADLVRPVLEEHCTSCHNASKQKGDLRLDTPEYIMEGGENGAILTAGKPEQSDLVRRITLPLYHDDRMPPDDKAPLPVGETELVRWWIEEGASFEEKVAEAEAIPPPVQTILNRHSAPQEERKTGLYALEEVSPPDSAAIRELEGAGLSVRPVAQDLPFLQVSAAGLGASFGSSGREGLRALAEQVTWLDLSGTDVGNADVQVVSGMKHLTRLYLQNTPVTDADLVHLKGLGRLEYLNLYGTGVTDRGLEHLASMKKLEALYLWQTQVSEEGARELQKRVPGLTVHQGGALAGADSTASLAAADDDAANEDE